ncbi:MAG TPA: tRNA epoxyqueuosine(34) reductase QueG, partial [Gammaproteobacteria bacterium]|nr:tRNA epoxyqueuosine(34) reductase QueG [Gammaproteobacteria bacterium]
MSDVDWQLLAKHIRNWSKQLGFAEVGFVNSEKSEHQSYLNEWLAKGYHGDMAYMAKHGHLRSEPASLHPGTRSIICLRL